MPYTPPKISRDDQIRQFFREHPDLQQQAAEGTLPPDFEMPFTQDSLADKKKKYYDKYPEEDPQSTTSKILEFLGLDQPYNEDSSSWDYNQKQWNKSLDEGNPDMSWFAQPTDDMADVGEGSMASPIGTYDPRTLNQYRQGRILDFLDFPLLGFGDEAVAGAEAAFRGKNYDEELEKARAIRALDDTYVPVWSRVPAYAASLPAGSPIYGAATGAANKGIEGIRKIFGFAPKATGATAKGAQAVAADSASLGAGDVIWQTGSAPGSVKERFDKYDPTQTAIFASFPVVGGAMSGIGYAAGKAAEGGKKVAKWLRGDKPKSTAPTATVRHRQPSAPNIDPKTMRAVTGKPKSPIDPYVPRQPKQPTVRDDLDAAIANSSKRKRK